MNNHHQGGFTVVKAAALGEHARKPISGIFVEGFYRWLRFFSRDKAKLALAFAHMFNMDAFYVACAGEDVVGIAACTNGQTPCVKLNPKELRRHLGFVSGMIAGFVLRDQFENHCYPFTLGTKEASVEFVATAPGYRGQGVASAIIRHFFAFGQFEDYVLEVADTNTSAVKLYEKLGFREFTRVKMKNSKQSGINYLVYMRYRKHAD